MSTEQLHEDASYWTLRKYARLRIIDVIPFARTEMRAAFEAHALPFTEYTKLYTLGPVGVELAKSRYDGTPLSGYLGYGLTRVMHDICVSETVLQLAKFASERGWIPSWEGLNEATLYSADGSRQLLEPDAMLLLEQKGKAPLRFLIEYHNEDHRTRAERKVDKYRNVCMINSSRWQTAWETDAFPPVLAVFRKKIVGYGYRDKLATLEASPVCFYGKLFVGVLKNNLTEWMNFTTRQRESIWGE
ncbi:MAG: hypothetical protein GY796_13300 [Chloroflexi bacterium]|nr:hypothetical protein [Chloroflexota bacterium]